MSSTRTALDLLKRVKHDKKVPSLPGQPSWHPYEDILEMKMTGKSPGSGVDGLPYFPDLAEIRKVTPELVMPGYEYTLDTTHPLRNISSRSFRCNRQTNDTKIKVTAGCSEIKVALFSRFKKSFVEIAVPATTSVDITYANCGLLPGDEGILILTNSSGTDSAFMFSPVL